MGFFVHSNTLEIRVTNLRGQDSLKEIAKSQSRSFYVTYTYSNNEKSHLIFLISKDLIKSGHYICKYLLICQSTTVEISFSIMSYISKLVVY